jgi:hypothetical protein
MSGSGHLAPPNIEHTLPTRSARWAPGLPPCRSRPATSTTTRWSRASYRHPPKQLPNISLTITWCEGWTRAPSQPSLSASQVANSSGGTTEMWMTIDFMYFSDLFLLTAKIRHRPMYGLAPTDVLDSDAYTLSGRST